MVVRAVDLDGTLALHYGGDKRIGAPIIKMWKRVNEWLKQGDEVIIFTARAYNMEGLSQIKNWLKEYGLPALEITNIKSPRFDIIYDDRAIQIIKNRGLFKCDE